MTRFCRYELRTTAVAGASAFYARVLGGDGVEVVPLPAEAPVAAVTGAGGELIARVTPPGAAPIATCHDPQGAIFALREPG